MTRAKRRRPVRTPSLADALIPLGTLVLLITTLIPPEHQL